MDSTLATAAGLQVSCADIYLGRTKVIHNCSLSVREGEAVGIIGQTGAGKTTLGRTISGELSLAEGSIAIRTPSGNVTLKNRGVPTAIKSGIFFVPATNGIFSGLTVRENLQTALSIFSLPRNSETEMITDVDALFPFLKTRQNQVAGLLSGGEKKMLSIARGVLSIRAAKSLRNPRTPAINLLIVDEPTHGLHPDSERLLEGLMLDLMNQGLSLIVLEENVPFAIRIASRCYLLQSGTIVGEEESSFLAASGELKGQGH